MRLRLRNGCLADALGNLNFADGSEHPHLLHEGLIADRLRLLAHLLHGLFIIYVADLTGNGRVRHPAAGEFEMRSAALFLL